MDAHLFRLFCRTAQPVLQGARIEKIQEPSPGIFSFSLYSQGVKRQLFFRFDRKAPFCFFSGARLAAQRAPSAMIMRIRRYFANRRIASAVCQFCGRKLWLLAAGEQVEGGIANVKLPWLCLDLKEGASLRFMDATEVPQPDEPLWPRPGELDDALRQWRDWPVLTPALRRTLSLLDEPDRWALMEDLRQGDGDVFTYTPAGDDARIGLVSAWPLPPSLANSAVEHHSGDVLAALEAAGTDLVLAALGEERENAILRPLRGRLRQIAKLREKLRLDESKFLALAAREADALALRENLWRWDADLRAPFVTVEDGCGPRKVQLDLRYDVRQNMERMFHSIRRAKRGLAMISQRREALAEEEAALAGGGCISPGHTVGACPAVNTTEKPEQATSSMSRLRALASMLPKNVQLYGGSDGYVYLRGKDARGNHAMRKYASPHDLWVHVMGGPGAHVIIRRPHAGHVVPDSILDEAGALAASKSWLCEAASAEVMFAEVRHVKPVRGGPAGKMTVDKIFLTRVVPVDRTVEDRLTKWRPPATA